MATLSDIVSNVTGLVGTASGIISKATSLASASISSIAKSLPISTGSFTEITSSLQSVSSITGLIAGGTSQAISKVNSLLGNSSDAINKPISFVTKSLSDTVDGFSTSKDLGNVGSIANDISSFTSTMLSIISARANKSTVVSTDDELDEAITIIADNNSTNTAAAVDILNNTTLDDQDETIGIAQTIRNGITEDTEVSNTVAGTSSTVNDKLTDISGNSSLLLAGTTVTENNLITASTSTLDDTTKSNISYLADDYEETTTSTLSTVMTNTLANISTSLDNTDGIEESYTNVLSLTDEEYPTYTSTGTTDEIDGITNSSSTLTKNDIVSLTTSIQSICPDVEVPTVDNYAELKALYDTALDLGTKNGMATTVKAMCKNTTYFDYRSIKILKSNIAMITKAGDVNMYKTIVEAIGAIYIANPLQDVKILNANMKATTKNVATYNEILTLLNIDPTDLVTVTTDYRGVTTYNAKQIALMSAGNTTTIDNIITKDVRNIALQLLTAYTD